MGDIFMQVTTLTCLMRSPVSATAVWDRGVRRASHVIGSWVHLLPYPPHKCTHAQTHVPSHTEDWFVSVCKSLICSLSSSTWNWKTFQVRDVVYGRTVRLPKNPLGRSNRQFLIGHLQLEDQLPC